MKPMLAKDATERDICFPVIASPKLDGVRGLVIDGVLRSRKLKRFPNEHVQASFSKRMLDGLDGELIMGKPHAERVFSTTQSATSNVLGEPEVCFYVFDCFDVQPGLPYEQRLAVVERRVKRAQDTGIRIEMLDFKRCASLKDVLAYEERQLDLGYEGLILRSPTGPYKQGRSTVREGWMLKLKRFMDGEAEIIGMDEEMLNGNDLKRDALGHAKRSSAQAGLSGKGRMGALRVRDRKSKVEFSIGTGFSAADRELFWKERRKVLGMVVKYKSFAIGVKDKPRFPVYLGMRPNHDL